MAYCSSEDTGDLIHSLDCRSPNLVYIGSASMYDGGAFYRLR
ncbi:MAG TPA: hypothetical protein VGI89_11970 [Rhizomicrobium sp.]|jgi:hypothetical protein